MRVLIVTQYFEPENFRINDLAKEFVKKGYHVDALVGIPNYPAGKYFDGYGLFKRRFEVVEGVNIYRCFQFPRGEKPGNFRLSLNYLSYMFCACLWVLFYFSFKRKYDVIIAYEPSPITLIVPAIVLGKIRKTRVISWIQDIWPDSITGNASERLKKFLWKPLSWLTEFVYRHSDKLLVSSKGMAELICRENDYTSKIVYVPNWADDFKKDNHDIDVPMPEGSFNLLMAGTLNEGIGVNAVCRFVQELSSNSDIKIIFLGGGSRKEELESYIKNHNLDNAIVLGQYPYEYMPMFYARADAMLLSLAPTEHKHLDVTVPARLQSYMSAGKPVFAMIGSGATEVITKAQCGFVVPAGDYMTLADLVKENYQNKELLTSLGHNARNAYELDFTIEAGIKRFEELFQEQYL